MAVFEQFPFTNFHEINLQWIIEKLNTIETEKGVSKEYVDEKTSSIKTTADTAKESADTALTTATTANNTAIAASSTATSASSLANTAKNTADSAATTANTNAISIHGANGTYDNSKGTIQARLISLEAGSGGSTADVTKAYVDEQDTKLSNRITTAQTTAESAVSAASTAQTTADSAVSAASAAQTTADSAVSAASAAQTTADNAVNTANSASTAAANAASKADTALSYLSWGKVLCGSTSVTVTEGNETVLDYAAAGFTWPPVVICQWSTTASAAKAPSNSMIKVFNRTKTSCKITISSGDVGVYYPIDYIIMGAMT